MNKAKSISDLLFGGATGTIDIIWGPDLSIPISDDTDLVRLRRYTNLSDKEEENDEA